MMFSTVRFNPANKDKWTVQFYDLEGDRVNEGSEPNGFGFYHYPRKMGKKKAFAALKKKMIDEHKAAIDTLIKSLKSLEELEMTK